MNQGAKIVTESIIGSDFRTVFVAGKAYTVYPPTIHKLAGAISHLSGVQEADNLKEVLLSLGESEAYSKALSWLIAGDENLSEELAKGTYEENVNALDEALSMIDSKVFLKAVSLARNVSLLAAKPRSQEMILSWDRLHRSWKICICHTGKWSMRYHTGI